MILGGKAGTREENEKHEPAEPKCFAHGQNVTTALAAVDHDRADKLREKRPNNGPPSQCIQR